MRHGDKIKNLGRKKAHREALYTRMQRAFARERIAAFAVAAQQAAIDRP